MGKVERETKREREEEEKHTCMPAEGQHLLLWHVGLCMLVCVCYFCGKVLSGYPQYRDITIVTLPHLINFFISCT